MPCGLPAVGEERGCAMRLRACCRKEDSCWPSKQASMHMPSAAAAKIAFICSGHVQQKTLDPKP